MLLENKADLFLIVLIFLQVRLGSKHQHREINARVSASRHEDMWAEIGLVHVQQTPCSIAHLAVSVVLLGDKITKKKKTEEIYWRTKSWTEINKC